MNFEVYSEESNVIEYSEYTAMIHKIEQNEENHQSHPGNQRRIYFNRDINYLVDGSGQEGVNIDRYSINIYDHDVNRMVLDKRSLRDGTVYRQYTYLSLNQYSKLMGGDTDWMRSSDQPLIRELYLQLTINRLTPGVVVDFHRSVYRLGYTGDHLIFDTAIDSTYEIIPEKLLDRDLQMKSRLEPNTIVMTYRQEMGIPKVLRHMLGLSQSVGQGL